MTNPDITPAGIAKALEGVTDGIWKVRGKQTVGVSTHTICKTLWQNGKKDAQFIAYARNALPLLAARMEALEAGARDNSEWARQAIADKEAAEKRVAELEANLRFQKTATEIMQNALVALSQCDHAVSAALYASDALGAVESINQEGR